jgi:hypothetical protein
MADHRRQLAENPRQVAPALGLAIERGQRGPARRIAGRLASGRGKGLLGLDRLAAR